MQITNQTWPTFPRSEPHYTTEMACTRKGTIDAVEHELNAATQPHFLVINHILEAPTKRHALYHYNFSNSKKYCDMENFNTTYYLLNNPK
jgi:hypothetical protein